jgi:hypothetical protein
MTVHAPDNSSELIVVAGALLHKLDRIVNALERESIVDVGLGAVNGPAQWLGNFPNPGHKRYLPTGRAQGSDSLAVPTGIANAVSVCGADSGRLGGTVVNFGANPVVLYLALTDTVAGGNENGLAALWLSASGGSWDFTLGSSSRPWCGPVAAVGQGGPSTLTVALT